ncbi:MAG: exosortase C-terminal domain/associated protein EpsI [Gemmatimonadales bacterium]
MPSHSVRIWIPVGLLSGGCALLLLATQQEAVPLVRPLEAVVPDSLLGRGSWDRIVDEAEAAVAGMDHYVMRFYANEPEPAYDFSVYIGYYLAQTQGKSIHSPKNCLPGAGWEAVSAETRIIETSQGSFEVNRYLLANKSARAIVYYWYQGRGRVAANEYGVKWELLRDKALHGRSDEALVRIVVPVRSSEEDADRYGIEAAAALIPVVFESLPGDPDPSGIQPSPPVIAATTHQ